MLKTVVLLNILCDSFFQDFVEYKNVQKNSIYLKYKYFVPLKHFWTVKLD